MVKPKTEAEWDTWARKSPCRPVSEETRAKLSEANRNRSLEAETLRRQKISTANKGKVRTQKQRDNMSESRKKLFAEGKIQPSVTHHTPEMREYLRQTTLQAWREGRLNKDGLVIGATRSTEDRAAAWTPEKRAAQAEKTLQAYKDGRVDAHGRYKGKWTIYSSLDRIVKMRSKSETLFAYCLDSFGIRWQYEPERFDLGWATYTPDFHLPEFDLWVEVKGFWTDTSLRKFTEFQQTHKAFAVLAQDLLKFKEI